MCEKITNYYKKFEGYLNIGENQTRLLVNTYLHLSKKGISNIYTRIRFLLENRFITTYIYLWLTIRFNMTLRSQDMKMP